MVHELAHGLVGRLHGLVVHEIDLLPIGGVSRLESFPATARDEFSMAIAGPAASPALALGAAAASLALSISLFPVDLVTGPFLARLAWLNLLLAAFNMFRPFRWTEAASSAHCSNCTTASSARRTSPPPPVDGSHSG